MMSLKYHVLKNSSRNQKTKIRLKVPDESSLWNKISIDLPTAEGASTEHPDAMSGQRIYFTWADLESKYELDIAKKDYALVSMFEREFEDHYATIPWGSFYSPHNMGDYGKGAMREGYVAAKFKAQEETDCLIRALGDGQSKT